ncbi:hypothetical protein PTI45_03160 [Paenibacillus nuruki]|uniref:Uncharacterized protein n=1 Tax=Paenibacillus nuruki TaxID=1886670 RepID=A0A1E3L3B2_9BACL|nr:hypothetical protein [Paenibacillus nuruki]ODP27450.1 hypothetical protein PTI45_03160 [Paenibacillus nuruki]
MSSALGFEHFVRNAFEFALKKEILRSDDPAGLAEAGYFNVSNDKVYLNKVKVAVTYAMEIYNRYIRNNCELSESDYDDLNNFVNSVLIADNANVIGNLIDSYKKKFSPYYS